MMKDQIFASFKSNTEAKQFMVNIENYNELNIYEFQNKVRRDV